MSRNALATCLCLSLFLVVGCPKQKPAEFVVSEGSSVMKEADTILAAVNDLDSAKIAAKKLEELAPRMKKVTAEYEKLSPEEQSKVKTQMNPHRQALAKHSVKMIDPAIRAVLMPAIGLLWSEGSKKSAQRVPTDWNAKVAAMRKLAGDGGAAGASTGSIPDLSGLGAGGQVDPEKVQDLLKKMQAQPNAQQVAKAIAAAAQAAQVAQDAGVSLNDVAASAGGGVSIPEGGNAKVDLGGVAAKTRAEAESKQKEAAAAFTQALKSGAAKDPAKQKELLNQLIKSSARSPEDAKNIQNALSAFNADSKTNLATLQDPKAPLQARQTAAAAIGARFVTMRNEERKDPSKAKELAAERQGIASGLAKLLKDSDKQMVTTAIGLVLQLGPEAAGMKPQLLDAKKAHPSLGGMVDLALSRLGQTK